MSRLLMKRPTLAIHCLDCKFSIMVYHDHDSLQPRWVAPSEDLSEDIPWGK